MDMVEKTRRSLTVLRRCQEADREELNYWIRRYSDAEDLKKGGHSRQQSPVTPDPVALGTGPSAVCLSVCLSGGWAAWRARGGHEAEAAFPGEVLGPW